MAIRRNNSIINKATETLRLLRHNFARTTNDDCFKSTNTPVGDYQQKTRLE
jgi:hypothetical protein